MGNVVQNQRAQGLASGRRFIMTRVSLCSVIHQVTSPAADNQAEIHTVEAEVRAGVMA